ncbi:MAG TPA: NAD(P)/FAD-dependent oxidoreductase [Terriglobia bacterium]|nr:NAD(P)/FAD-dependent oxidoreductase [Terriglobia bacterium]
MFDLAIIGGGPAGTAAALEARCCGLRVAVWERDRFPRHKVCGEFISAEALPWLQHAAPQTLVRGSVLHRAEFVSESGLARGFDFARPALGLSRYLLDRALWRAAAEAGAEVREGESIRAVRKLRDSRRDGVWELESADGYTEKAKALIVACGRWWALEGFSSPAQERKPAGAGKWIGVKAHFAGLDPRGSVEMYLFRGGYCGLAPIEDGEYNVCCLLHRRCLREAGMQGIEDFAAWLVQVSCHAALAARLQVAQQVSPTVTTSPVRLARRQPAEEGALLVGDASGFLDPFTGEGISIALHSGRLAARAIAASLSKGCGDEHGAEIYRQSLRQAVRRSYKIAALARGLLHGPAWVQSLAATPLPWLGSWLFRETRWRGAPEDEAP